RRTLQCRCRPGPHFRRQQVDRCGRADADLCLGFRGRLHGHRRDGLPRLQRGRDLHRRVDRHRPQRRGEQPARPSPRARAPDPPPDVIAAAPTANPGGPYNADVGQTLTFDGSGSIGAVGQTLTFAWDFGDGSTGTGETATHAYSAAGTFTVALTVTDRNGGANSPPDPPLGHAPPTRHLT